MSLLRSIWRRSRLCGASVNRLPTPRHSSSVAQTRDGKGLVIDAFGGATFPFVWLRDSCPSTIHPTTSQKLRRTSDIPPDTRPAASDDSVRLTDAGLHIHWADGHASFFPHDFLQLHSSPSRLAEFHCANPNLFVSYESLNHDDGLRSCVTVLVDPLRLLDFWTDGRPALRTRRTRRASCVRSRPSSATSGRRSTGRCGTVVNVRDSRNIAYTNLDLGFHMDLLSVHLRVSLLAEAQLMRDAGTLITRPSTKSCIVCATASCGGASLFADAFRAAETLRCDHPDEFAALATTERLSSSPAPPLFYDGLRRFASYLDDPAYGSVYEYQLREGDAVIFDNRRVLHARTAFSEIEGGEGKGTAGGGKDGEPNRWLKGCYFEADALLDRARMVGSNKDRRGSNKDRSTRMFHPPLKPLQDFEGSSLEAEVLRNRRALELLQDLLKSRR
ncbi:Clavaminate synthase-like protein [Mycena metata]|uniref:Clavaminate synthase-like protein n=1 Tax=Mycena metata TaxID=1033252 RepID=A0AAD7N392_9AGAR|nr:Clavaminate synthase-like protein [Mycena metata]